MDRRAARFLIKGWVQGVGYRWWAVGEAKRLKLEGWVRNRTDGSVELLAMGAEAAIDALEAACRSGPAGARVSEIERLPAEDDGADGFQERPTL